MIWEVEFRSKKVINNEIVVRLKKKKTQPKTCPWSQDIWAFFPGHLKEPPSGSRELYP